MAWWVWVLLAAWLFGPAVFLFVGVRRIDNRQRREAQMWAYWDGEFTEEGHVWP